MDEAASGTDVALEVISVRYLPDEIFLAVSRWSWLRATPVPRVFRGRQYERLRKPILSASVDQNDDGSQRDHLHQVDRNACAG